MKVARNSSSMVEKGRAAFPTTVGTDSEPEAPRADPDWPDSASNMPPTNPEFRGFSILAGEPPSLELLTGTLSS